jgi:hypothetical protein
VYLFVVQVTAARQPNLDSNVPSPWVMMQQVGARSFANANTSRSAPRRSWSEAGCACVLFGCVIVLSLRTSSGMKDSELVSRGKIPSPCEWVIRRLKCAFYPSCQDDLRGSTCSCKLQREVGFVQRAVLACMQGGSE